MTTTKRSLFVFTLSALLMQSSFGQDSAPAQGSPFSSFLRGLAGALEGGKPADQGAKPATPPADPNTFERPAASKDYGAWTDFQFLPEEKNGATRLRLGLSSVSNYQPYPALTPAAQGATTCDLEYLFFAKSNTRPSTEELERCALQEEAAYAKASRVQRDVANAFVRSDVIKEWTPKIFDRIEFLKGKSKFYFRPNFARLEGFDAKANGFPLVIGVGNFGPTTYFSGMVDHSFFGLGIDPNSNVFRFNVSLPENVARRLENATRKMGYIDYGLIEFHFRLESVEMRPIAKKYSPVRVYFVSDIGWSLPFTDPANPSVKTTLSVGIPQ